MTPVKPSGGGVLRILIVDDDELDRMAIRRALRSVGFETIVEEVEEAEEALLRMSQGSLDCALLDFRLPGTDGLEVLARARAAGMRAPVIVLTGFGDEQTAVALMQAGAADYIPKSTLSSERLGRSITAAVRVAAAERHAEEAEVAREQYTRQLLALADAALAINGSLSLDAVLHTVADRAREIINVREAVASYAMNCDLGSAITTVARMNHATESLGDGRTTVGMDPHGLASSVCEANAPMRLGRTELEALAERYRGEEREVAGPPMSGWLAAPFIGRNGHNFGVIQLVDRSAGDFSEGDQAILVQLAHLASVAIENARLYEAAQAATRARDETLAIVSHDLRNPVHTITMASSLLLDLAPESGDRRSGRKHLSMIRRAAELANRLIGDLLDAARIEAGQLSIHLTPEDVDALVTETVETHAVLASARGMTVVAELPEDLPPAVADRERILQVFANLIGNAIKFGREDSAVTVTATADAEWVTFSVSDSGPGIAAEDLGRLFDRFWQANRAQNVGAGLGLFVAKGIVEAHGGRIWVDTRLGEWSTFYFTLPADGAFDRDLVATDALLASGERGNPLGNSADN